MARDLPSPGMPSVFEQLSALPATPKLLVGLAMIAMGVGSVAMLDESLLSWVLLVIAGLIGVPLVFQAQWQRREASVAASEMDRARGEIEQLSREVEAVVGDRRGVERFLIERGYTSAKVRRWIALECGVVLPVASRLLR